nr:alpha/beta hydrolase fold domain-containing protein [Sphingomonas sp. BT553]
MVWVHGGAFIIGSLDAREAHWPAIKLAAGGIPVLSVDYRMCIEGVHYPAPQDDVLAAWQWACDSAETLGVTREQLHLGGGSAGACLVAGATLRLRDTGKALPASLYLAYPVLEGRLPPATPDMLAELSASKLPADEWIAEMFATWAGAARWDDPYVAPGLADPSGLPPTYVLTCGRDALRRSSEPYVTRLTEAGVTVWHDVLSHSEHAPLDRPGTPDGERAVARLGTWLRAGIAGMSE